MGRLGITQENNLQVHVMYRTSFVHWISGNNPLQKISVFKVMQSIVILGIANVTGQYCLFCYYSIKLCFCSFLWLNPDIVNV